MKTINLNRLLLLGLLLSVNFSFSQDQATVYTKKNEESTIVKSTMKTYLIEREIPDAGKLTAEQLREISQKSNAVLAEMGPGIQWVHSYVTENKVYCIYKAENKIAIAKHAEKGGFPANRISELTVTINPGTGRD